MKALARLRFFGVAPLKVRRFARTIKGEDVTRAMAILDLQSSPTCQTLGKLLRSAVANAYHKEELAPENLFVSNVQVDQGPSMKRIKPRARGRAYRILKRSSHVTIEVDLKPGLQAEEPQPDKPKTKRRRGSQAKDSEKDQGTEQKKAKAPAAKSTAKTKTEKAAKTGRATKAKTGTKTAADAKEDKPAKSTSKAKPATKSAKTAKGASSEKQAKPAADEKPAPRKRTRSKPKEDQE